MITSGEKKRKVCGKGTKKIANRRPPPIIFSKTDGRFQLFLVILQPK